MALQQAVAGTPIEDICRKLEVRQALFFRWTKQYAGMGVFELRELRQLREENKKLKQLVADLSLDKTISQDALRNKWRCRRSNECWRSGRKRPTGSPSDEHAEPSAPHERRFATAASGRPRSR